MNSAGLYYRQIASSNVKLGLTHDPGVGGLVGRVTTAGSRLQTTAVDNGDIPAAIAD